MIIGVLKEPEFEKRVSLLPEAVKILKNLKADIAVEKNAGESAFASDKEYLDAGSEILDRDQVIEKEG